MMENWADIIGMEGKFQVSDLGRVRSLSYPVIDYRGYTLRINKGRIHTPRKHTGGYLRVQLHRKDYYIHRLVATHFKIRREDQTYVNHLDGDKTNNKATNLEWCTQSENLKHSYKFLNRINPGKGKFGGLNHYARKVMAVGDEGIIICDSRMELAARLGVCHQSVSEALMNGHRCKGFKIMNA